MAEERVRRFWFNYSNSIALPASTAEQQLQLGPVENEYDFYWVKGMYSSNIAAVMAGSDITFGGALVQIKGGSSQQFFTKNPAPIHHFFGLPGLGFGPVVLPIMQLIPASVAITIGISNQIAGAQTVHITAIGVHVDKGQPFKWPS